MALDLTSAFDDEEDDKKIASPVVSTGKLDLTSAFDEGEEDENAVVEQQPKPETPEAAYLRTGEVPKGFEYVPSVPTGDAPEDRVRLEPIDAPDVTEQTDEAFSATKDIVRDLYGEEGTVGLTQTADFTGLKGLSKEYVPEVLQPFSNIVAQTTNDALGLLLTGVVGAAESVPEAAEKVTRIMHDTFDEDNKIMGMTGKELIPFTPEVSGRKFGADILSALEISGFQAPSAVAGSTNKLLKKAVKEARAEAKLADSINNKRMRINIAKNATEENIAAKTAKAEKVAAHNTDLKNELILGFEEATGKVISKEVDGVRVVDDELARQAGKETAQEIKFKQRKTTPGDIITSGKNVEIDDADDTAKMLFEMQTAGDDIVAPILKPEKLDGLVAAAADLKEKYPGAFNNDKTIIDNLLDLTIDKDLIAGDELIDVLNKYNVSFEDYILTVVGSGSEAGKVLNKLSQIKRSRPINEMQQLQREATEAQQGQIRSNIMRIEGIRRGGLVSQIATASRNLTSAGIRAPLDSLGNLMDTALYNMGKAEGIVGKAGAGTKALVSKENWSGSFANMKYMFGPESRLDAIDYVDFILDRPELSKQFDMMFNQLNELQQATGRGMPRQKQIDEYIKTAKEQAKKDGVRLNKSKLQKEAEEYADRGIFGIEAGKKYTKGFNTFSRAGDTVLSELEDAVSVLNTANRWQEYLVRRGAFLGELERLTKREYGIDLIEALNAGKITDLLNDATSVRPKDARSFKELIADSTNKALDVTYAKQPESQMFREATSFITRNGLTVVMPFPRFMFNSLELMGNYAGGASIPLTKKLMGLIPKGTALSAKDRQRISRNLLGFGAIGAAYLARSDPDAPADYKELAVGDGTVLDTTPQFPLRQMLYLGEATRRLKDGTFGDFWNGREFAETFLGTNIRVGVGNSIVDEVIELSGGSDLTKDEAAARRTGRLLGNYLSTWAVPFAQVIDTERALGMRGEEYKDVAQDPTLEFLPTLGREIRRPFEARGLISRDVRVDEDGNVNERDAELDVNKDGVISEDELPARERLFQDKSSRVGSGIKVGLGLSMRTKDSEEGEYIKRLGLSEFELGSTSKVPSIRNFENAQLRDLIPGIVNAAQAYEEELRDTYRSNKALQDEMSEQKYVNSQIKPLIKIQIRDAKRNLTDGNTVNSEAPEYIAAMTAYRRLPSDLRKAAAAQFIQRNERPADGASTQDLFELAEIGKALKQAYKP